MTQKANIDYYDEFSTLYEKERWKPYHRFLDESEIEAARPYCEGKEVLEVGCGTGLVLEPLSLIGSKASGIDLSRGMIEKAAARGLNVTQASATNLPFDDDSFDCVVSFKVLAHIPDIAQAVAECARVTRPGGHVVLEFYNRHSIRQLVKMAKPAQKVADTGTTDDQVYTRYDTLNDIRGYLPPGMEVVKVGGFRCLAPTYHFYNAPVVGKATVAVESLLRKTPLSRFGGFLIVVARKS